MRNQLTHMMLAVLLNCTFQMYFTQVPGSAFIVFVQCGLAYLALQKNVDGTFAMGNDTDGCACLEVGYLVCVLATVDDCFDDVLWPDWRRIGFALC